MFLRKAAQLGRWMAASGLVTLAVACQARSQQTLTVSIAASMADAATEIAEAFEAQNPGITVENNLASSGVLAAQIRQGAPVDVFISAAIVVMDDLEAEGLLEPDTRRDIAANRLVLVAPLEGFAPPGLEDLSSVDWIGLGDPDLVPAGAYSRESLMALGLWDTLEGQLVYADNVRQVLTWVETGEVSAGFVYTSDAQSSQRVRTVAVVPQSLHRPIRYPIAVVRESRLPGQARAFVDFVSGPRGQAVLVRYGFEIPDGVGS